MKLSTRQQQLLIDLITLINDSKKEVETCMINKYLNSIQTATEIIVFNKKEFELTRIDAELLSLHHNKYDVGLIK